MATRKKRTRAHIIADISENHFEGYALVTGFSTERTVHDYGYDILLSTYDQNGEIEPGLVYVQLKATDDLNLIKNNTAISFAVDKRDLNLWQKEFYPVIFVVYDAPNKNGYWLYIQKYLKSLENFSIVSIGDTFNIHIPIVNKINEETMTEIRGLKEKRNSMAQEIIDHY